MQQARFNLLFSKYFDKSATLQERDELFVWINESSNKVEVEEIMERYWNQFSAEKNPFSDQDKLVMLQNVHQFTNKENSKKPVKIFKIFSRWAVAASILLAVTIGSYSYYHIKNQSNQTIAYHNDIAPGKSGATLTLANGEQILIKDALTGNIANQSGVKISKTADGQIVYEITNNDLSKIGYNTLSTTRGEQTQVRLPDGTVVFLNSESSLKYPTNFSKSDKRLVYLTGEGYFEVAKDKKHPFIVENKAQTIEVLGTHFNVNTYDDEPFVKTTLLEGSLRVNAGLHNVTIKPGEQSKFIGNKFDVEQVDVDEVVAWKDGIFQFSDERLESIMNKLSRWYDVDVEYANNEVKDVPLTGFITHFNHASKVLRMLELTKQVRFKIEGKKIIVMNYKTK